MHLGLPDALPSLVAAKFVSAKATSSLLFSPTELALIHTSRGVPFQLRFCPSLAQKPAKKQISDALAAKPDPFANPSPSLLIADIPTQAPSHLLVLNKFPIIPEHFILATRENKKQSSALEQDDLEATYACLKAWGEGEGSGDGPRRLFAFFNAGMHSGASQPHRHIQFLPLESLCASSEVSGSWGLLVDRVVARSGAGAGGELLQHPDLPIAHFARSFASEPSGAELASMYNELYSLAKDAVDEFILANPEQLALHPVDGGDLPISYNLAMTTAGMMIVPRRSEGMVLQEGGRDIGFVELNGTTLGGTMMVKQRDQWDLLRSKPEILDSMLMAVGIPRKPLQPKAHV